MRSIVKAIIIAGGLYTYLNAHSYAASIRNTWTKTISFLLVGTQPVGSQPMNTGDPFTDWLKGLTLEHDNYKLEEECRQQMTEFQNFMAMKGLAGVQPLPSNYCHSKRS